MSVTVAMTCDLKARSVVCRFLLAMWMKRSLLARPNPYRSGWLRMTWKVEFSSGLTAKKGLLLAVRKPV